MVERRTTGTSEHICWNAAILLPDFSYGELARKTGLTPPTISRFVSDWVARGMAEKLGKIDGELRARVIDPETYRPVKAGPGSRAPSKSRNMWTAMRGLREFTVTDVAAHACTGEIEVSEDEARKYCQLLALSGYLKVVQKARGGYRPAVYRLVKNSGPQPPRERRVRAVYDDNAGEFAYVAAVAR